MKLFLLAVLLFTLYSIPPIQAQYFGDHEESIEKGTVGLGIQGSYPFAGISGIVNIKNRAGIQLIYGALGDISSFSARSLINLIVKPNHSAYVYGSIGQYKYTESFSLFFSEEDQRTETIRGYGIGIGIEYSLESFSNRGIPIWVNIEVGYGNIDFNEVDFETSAITAGGGIHYYFGNN